MNKRLITLKTILCMILVMSFIKIDSRTFVDPQIGDTITDVALKTGETLNQVRATIGEIILASTTITSPGYYLLGDTFEGSITIDSDDVTLNLNQFQLYDNTGTTTLITIENDTNNIFIKNGSLKGSGDTSSASGIYINPGACGVNVDNLCISDVQNGILLDGIQTNSIENCQATNCFFTYCQKAVVLNYAQSCVFKSCEALKCKESGFELYHSSLNKCIDCEVLEIKNDDPDTSIFGFASTNGKGNLFLNDIVDGLSKITSSNMTNATGFFLGDNELESQIVNSLANQIECLGNGDSYGMRLLTNFFDPQLTYTLDWDSGTDSSNAANSVAWSPDGQHVAYAGSVQESSDSNIIVQVLDASTLALQLTYTLDWAGNSDEANSIAWSPDGQHVAYAGSVHEGSDENIIVQVLDASTLALQLTYTLDWAGNSDEAYSIAWSPDGQHIAYSGSVEQGSNSNIIVQVLDASTLDLQLTYTLDWAGNSDEAYSIAWSPDGQHIAYAGLARQSSNWNIIVQVLDASTLDLQLTYTLDWSSGLDIAYSIAWSPDGQHIAYSGSAQQGSNSNIIVQVLDASTLDLQLTYTLDWSSGLDISYSIAWSPDGQHIAYSGSVQQGSNFNIIVQVLEFIYSAAASKCSAKNNKISNCTSDQTGIGLQGDDSNNLIIKNIAYNNDTNFSGISNIYTGGISGTPGNLQNISLP